MKEKSCPECDGTGKVPQYPNPYTPLPANVIHAIRVNAPDCVRCGGTGKVEEE